MQAPDLSKFSSIKQHKAKFLQITGEEGSGSRRLVFSFVEAGARAIWISSQWKIYAPALWDIAKEKNIFLAGIENPKELSYRKLFSELYEANVFNFWILDHLHLNASEGFFLQKLLQATNTQVIVLDPYPQSFCQKRLKIFLSHQHYRIQWTKGGPLNPEYIPARSLMDLQEDICSLSV